MRRSVRQIKAWCVVLLAVSLAFTITGCFGAEEEEGAESAENEESTEEESDAPLTFATIYELDLVSECVDCHAPGADGFVDGVEATQNWSDIETAYASLQGTAPGLIGNFQGCNDVPLIGDSPETSLLVAVLDEDVRAEFSLPDYPDCNADGIADMSLKISGDVDEVELEMLKAWISAGVPE